jgi:hypothetical protein
MLRLTDEMQQLNAMRRSQRDRFIFAMKADSAWSQQKRKGPFHQLQQQQQQQQLITAITTTKK